MLVDGYFMCSQAKVLNSFQDKILWRIPLKCKTHADSEFSAMLYGRIEVAMLE